MKKFLSAAMVVLVVAFTANICAANSYDRDPNYKQIYSHQDSQEYLYLPSIRVQEYNPPHYQITFNSVSVNSNTQRESWSYNRVKFNWDTKEVFVYNNGSWIKLGVDGNYGTATRNRFFADVLFRAAYGMDFYGY